MSLRRINFSSNLKVSLIPLFPTQKTQNVIEENQLLSSNLKYHSSILHTQKTQNVIEENQLLFQPQSITHLSFTPRELKMSLIESTFPVDQ